MLVENGVESSPKLSTPGGDYEASLEKCSVIVRIATRELGAEGDAFFFRHEMIETAV